MRRVSIVGIGSTQFRPETPEKNFKELMYEAASRAYIDAGIDPRKDLDCVITSSEDLWEGVAIFDEYVPDQLGGVLKPVFTVGGDGLHGIIHGYMLIKTGYFDLVAVEAHSKASEIEDIDKVYRFALDPIYIRPVVDQPHGLAALEMMNTMRLFDITYDILDMTIMKNHLNALEWGSTYARIFDYENIEASEYIAQPLREVDISPHTDGAIVTVLASEEKARELTDDPIWIDGVGWATQSGRYERMLHNPPVALNTAANKAYEMAGIENPFKELDFAEVDDRYSFREPASLSMLRLDGGNLMEMVSEGVYTLDGELPVNTGGGFLGNGYPLEAGGLMKLLHAVKQLRGEAGSNQLDDPEKALVSTRREIPSSSYAVVILSR
ncbi:MAG TPA: hypothetical protein EYH44_05885 [Thermoprotei archaeon]|nr:hypothetical protein [Thermoprotei archaeon]